MIYLVLQLIALAISLVRGLAMVASVVFNALLLVVFIACHLRELMRAVAAQPVGVQLVIYSQMFIIAHAALAGLVSR